MKLSFQSHIKPFERTEVATIKILLRSPINTVPVLVGSNLDYACRNMILDNWPGSEMPELSHGVGELLSFPYHDSI